MVIETYFYLQFYMGVKLVCHIKEGIYSEGLYRVFHDFRA